MSGRYGQMRRWRHVWGVSIRRLTILLTVVATACAGGSDEVSRDSSAQLSRGGIVGAPAKDSAVGAGASAGGEREGADTGGRSAPPVVLIAGTSLTAGLGLDPSDAYPAVLQRFADSAGIAVRIVNGGSSGETSAGLVRRIDWLLREPPDVVVIETGANDGLRGLEPDSTAANLRRAVARVRELAPRARVLIVQMEAPPNMGSDYTAHFRGIYPAVARESGATLVPFLLEGVAGVRSLNQADGIHPNEEGARIAARTVWRVLGPVLSEVDAPAERR